MEELRFDGEVTELSNLDSKKNVSSEGLFELAKFGLLKCVASGGDRLFKDNKNSLNFGNGSFDKNNDDSGRFSTRPKKLYGTCNICCNACDNNVSEKSELSSDESIEYQFDKSKSNSDTYNNDHSGLNFLAFLVILVTKTIGFQFSVALSLFTFPIWLSYFSFMFFMFPLQTLLRVKNCFSKMMYLDFSVPVFSGSLGAKKSIMRLGRALLVSIYVCSVLFGLLVLGFVIGSFAMRHIVEEPITARESLHFDYTKNSPVVFVPIMGPANGNVAPFEEVGRPVSARFIPYNRKIKLKLSITMPESDYNMKLGMFQVRMELLSRNGKVTATSTYPTMLRYRSQPIRTVQTILKGPQLIFGHHTESQTLDVKMNNFIEGPEPTSCFKVTLEQRAEFQRGAGIPEIYEALLLVESELPKFKKLVWDWRRTVFVWVSTMSFLTELVFFYVFFRWVIVPRSSSGLSIVVAKKKSDVASTVSWYKTI